MTVRVSRIKGHCSVCPRGHGAATHVTLIKLARSPRPRPYQWLGLCLVCAKAVAKEVTR